MVAWSSVFRKTVPEANLLRNLLYVSKNGKNSQVINYVPARCSSHRELNIRTSVYQYIKFKDMLNFYLLIGVIPLSLIIGYCSIFIGPATLALPPEGYEPKHWEYHRHPITRFFAKYIIKSPQELYERNLHDVFVTQEKFLLRSLEQKVMRLMRERGDYQAWYYEKPLVKYPRIEKEKLDEIKMNERGKIAGEYIT